MVVERVRGFKASYKTNLFMRAIEIFALDAFSHSHFSPLPTLATYHAIPSACLILLYSFPSRSRSSLSSLPPCLSRCTPLS